MSGVKREVLEPENGESPFDEAGLLALDPKRLQGEPRRLLEAPLIVFVGLTGVGKTTAVAGALGRRPLHLLPNRRWIADRLILPAMLAEIGEAPRPVTDRRRRFELTALYRSRFEGGLAHALGLLWIDVERVEPPYVFDGLRGVEEVSWAAREMPLSRFVVLDAPEPVRLQRLLGRGESFDRAHVDMAEGGLREALASLEGIDTVFSEAELSALVESPEIRAHPVGTIVEKAAILVEERRNYDSRRALAALESLLPASRLLSLDTARLDGGQVASRIVSWVG